MSSPNPSGDRLRFAEFMLDRLPNGRCRARVGLTWKESEQFTGESEGLGSQAGELRTAAEACVRALTDAVQGAMGFELLGVKAVRAFDATVVIVSTGCSRRGKRSSRSRVLPYRDRCRPRRGAGRSQRHQSHPGQSALYALSRKAKGDCLRSHLVRRNATRTPAEGEAEPGPGSPSVSGVSSMSRLPPPPSARPGRLRRVQQPNTGVPTRNPHRPKPRPFPKTRWREEDTGVPPARSVSRHPDSHRRARRRASTRGRLRRGRGGARGARRIGAAPTDDGDVPTPDKRRAARTRSPGTSTSRPSTTTPGSSIT